MRVKRVRMKNSVFPTSRVRFSGYSTWKWPTNPGRERTWQKAWYIDLIKYDRSSPDSYWMIYKTYNWDVVGMYYPTSYDRFKNLHEFQQWLFLESL